MKRNSNTADTERDPMGENRLEWDTPMYRLAVAQLDRTADGHITLDPTLHHCSFRFDGSDDTTLGAKPEEALDIELALDRPTEVHVGRSAKLAEDRDVPADQGGDCLVLVGEAPVASRCCSVLWRIHGVEPVLPCFLFSS